MLILLDNLIPVLFYFLSFLIPLFFCPWTSELFEFNKMVFVYFMTTLIAGVWIIKMIIQKKIIFRRTLLDLPLIIFLSSQILSTLSSIDFRTSFLGYYSRFNGGLLSTVSYLLLYWAFVSNFDKEKVIKFLKITVISGLLVSFYGIAQHFGIDKDLWIQDVQNRVFSTFGQPNWLAAWLIAVVPLSWAWGINSKIKSKEFIFCLIATSLFFTTLVFTKSRSGILGFFITDFLFWLIAFLKSQERKEILKKLFLYNFIFLFFVFIFGTPWTPNFKQIVNKDYRSENTPTFSPNTPALEVGGTESSEIRKIVWQGAFDLFKKYPILGTGVETFAFSYYEVRPLAHNLVSEWDFLYNKAHNEYLNFLATTGIVGLTSYLFLIGVILFLLLKKIQNKNETAEFKNYHLAFLVGFSGILITNFFGFSVVPVAFLFFLFPAFSLSLEINQFPPKPKQLELTNSQKVLIVLTLSLSAYLIYLIFQYWSADKLYNQGKSLNDQGKYPQAREFLVKAIGKSPQEAIFWDEISQTDTGLSNLLLEGKDEKNAQKFANQALTEIEKAKSLSPRNLNIRRDESTLYLKLSSLNPNYLSKALNSFIETSLLAPTDAKVFYNIGLTYARLGETKKAQETLEKTIQMKANYRDARFALALIYEDLKKYQDAKTQLEYILKYIEPNDKLVKDELTSLNAQK